MKALSVMQPHASLLLGPKSIETRSWSTEFRGWLAIHASKRFPRDTIELCFEDPFAGALVSLGYPTPRALPLGAIIGVGNLHKVGEILRRRDGAIMVRGRALPVTGDELEFGNYEPGRFGWMFANVHRLLEPIPCRGSLGLFVLPDDVAAAVTSQVREAS